MDIKHPALTLQKPINGQNSEPPSHIISKWAMTTSTSYLIHY